MKYQQIFAINISDILGSMNTKALIYIGIFVGSTIGSWLGSLPDHGNFLGGWSILGGLVGSVAGIWAGFKLGQ